MKQKTLRFLKAFLPFSIFIALLQFALAEYFFSEVSFYYSTASIMVFLVVATFIINMALILVHQQFSEYTGFAFMGLSLLKMLAAVLFLLPMITCDNFEQPLENIFFFFIPYFLFLIFETLIAVRLLNLK